MCTFKSSLSHFGHMQFPMLVQSLPFAKRSREYFWVDIHLGWGTYDRQHATSVYVRFFA